MIHLASFERFLLECHVTCLSSLTPSFANQSTIGFTSLNTCVMWTHSTLSRIAHVSLIKFEIVHKVWDKHLMQSIIFFESPSNQSFMIPISKAVLNILTSHPSFSEVVSLNSQRERKSCHTLTKVVPYNTSTTRGPGVPF